jgi:transposase-like protein
MPHGQEDVRSVCPIHQGAQPPTMQMPNDATLRAVRLRMSPPDRKTVAEIARDKGITAQTQYNWLPSGRCRAI